MAIPLTSLERRYGGARFDFWPDQASIDDNWPRIWECQRAELVDVGLPTERVQLHGRSVEIDTHADRTYGQPTPDYNSYVFGPLEIAAVPTIGLLTWRPADTLSGIAGSIVAGTRITVARDGQFQLNIGASTWTPLTGGTASPIQGATYNAVTGDLTITEAGIYQVSLSASLFRAVGISAPNIDATVAVNGAQSTIMSRTTLTGLNDTRNTSCTAELTLPAGAVLTASIRSSLAIALQVTDFVLSVRS